MTTPDKDFEFFNSNPTPTQIREYMTWVRREEREKAWKEILVHNAKSRKDIYLPVDMMNLLHFD